MADSSPAIPQTMSETRLTRTPSSRARSAFSAAAREAIPYRVKRKKSANPMRTTGPTIRTMKWSAVKFTLPNSKETPHGTLELGGELFRGDVPFEPARERKLERTEDLCHPDRRHRQDQPRRVAEPTDDPELHDEAGDYRSCEPGQNGEHVRHLVDGEQLGGQNGSEGTELPLSEVDDPVRPVDEDETDRDQRVEKSDDDPLQVQAVRNVCGVGDRGKDDLAEQNDDGESGKESAGAIEHATISQFQVGPSPER